MLSADLHALLTPGRLDAAAAHWGAVEQSVRFIRALENFVYEFKTTERPLILRFTHSSHRTTEEVTAELEFVDFLGRQEVPVARAVPSLAGRLIEHLPVKEGYFSVAAFEKAPGAKAAFDLPAPTQDALYRGWGRMIGAMHRHIPRYRNGQGDPRRPVGIESHLLRNAAKYLPADRHHVLPMLDDLLSKIRTFPTTALHYGLLHADCHHGNFHVEGRRLTLFDFDDCCHHWLAYDLTIPIWHFPLPDRGRDPARDRATLTHFALELIRGYQEQNRFQKLWLDQLRLFIRLRDFQLFSFSWKTWDPAEPEPWQPKFWRERGDLIEAGQPSVDLNWADLSF